MKNKFDKTGLEFGNKPNSAIKSRNSSISNEQIKELKARCPNPKRTKKIILWLMGIVNSKEEYEQLQKDLAEIEALISFNSSQLKGGAE